MIVGPAFTVKFLAENPFTIPERLPKYSKSIEPGVQWSDLVKNGSVVVVQQPEGQRCAVVGGIHMARLCAKGARGLVVDGNVRDLRELNRMDLVVSLVGSSVAWGMAWTLGLIFFPFWDVG